MENITKLNIEKTNKSFIRVIILDSIIKILHIKSNNIFFSQDFSMPDIGNILSYLGVYQKTPVEIIVGGKGMNCKSISNESLSKKDLKAMASNSIESEQTPVNTVFYTKQQISESLRKSFICETTLSQETADIIGSLFSIKNSIRCISSWPVWLVFGYFNKFLEDEDKFTCSVFFLENIDGWEIIGYSSGNFACHRRGRNKNFNKNTELSNTIKYLAQIQKIPAQDIAIYIINDAIVNELTSESDQNMSIISNIINIDNLPAKRNISKIVNTGLYSAYSFFIFATIFNVFSAFNFYKKIAETEKILQSGDKNIIKEISFWQTLDDKTTTQANFKESFYSDISVKNKALLKSISMTLNPDDMQINISKEIE